MEASEAGLIQRARAGERPALVDLLQRHDDELRRFLSPRMPQRLQHLVAIDDVIQQTYTDILLSAARLPDAAAFPAWLRRCAARNLIDVIRMLEAAKRPHERESGDSRPKLAGFDPLAFLEDVLSSGGTRTTPSRQMARAEAQQLVREAVERLPEPYRTVVRQLDLEGRGVAQVAAELNRTAGDIYTIRSRAFKELRDRFDGRSTLFFRLL